MARDLIVFGEDWGGLPSSTQHLIRHLTRDRKVLWINSIGLRRPHLTGHDLKRIWAKLLGRRKPSPKKRGEGDESPFPVISPRTLPAPRSRLERRLAAWLLERQIRPAIEKAGLRDPILWTSLPTAVDLAGRLGDRGLVYYCGDDFSALAGVDHGVVAQREAELAQKAGLILAASEALAMRFPPAKTRLLPHGVDFGLFARPAPRAADLPDDGRPIAGFYGSISEWLDLPLLAGVARRLPDWHFVLIGKAVVDLAPLANCNNLTLLGPRPHHRLPGYSQHWTVSLLPFVDNAQIRACNPLKLREYLAAGRPIVATAFPALDAYPGLIRIAEAVDGMVDAITTAEVGHDPAALRMAVADHTWQARATRVADWLEGI